MNFKDQIAKIILEHEISLEMIEEFQPTDEQMQRVKELEGRLWEQ